MATSTKLTITLKLLVDAKSNRVAYAEAGKDFVDFLFGLLELPIANILSLLVGRGMSVSGSLSKVYESVKNLDKDYLQSDKTRNSLLSPKIVDDPNSKSNKAKPTPLLKQLAYARQESYYSSYPFGYSSSSSSSKDVVEGHVKGGVTYMVMDDLVVKPMSTISSVSVLNTMRVKDFGSLEEKTVEVDMDKGLKLLKAAFESTTVLSDVFLPAMPLPAATKRKRNT